MRIIFGITNVLACCEQWNEGFYAIHSGLQMAAANGTATKTSPWSYCPWCGTSFVSRKEIPMDQVKTADRSKLAIGFGEPAEPNAFQLGAEIRRLGLTGDNNTVCSIAD